MNLDELVKQREINNPLLSPETEAGKSRARDLETILAIVRKINTSLVLNDVLQLVVDEAIRIAKAERGFLMLADRGHGLRFVVGRSADGTSIDAKFFQVSSTILEDVFETGESICVENALNDQRFERRQSIMDLELQTIMCSPLRTEDETIGVVYVDSKRIQAVDTAYILSLFEILAGQAAIAIKNTQLYHDVQTAYNELRETNDQLVKFERLATRGELASEVSHELKNLVAVVMLQINVLQRRLDTLSPDAIQDRLDQTLTAATRIASFSESLLSSAHATGNLVPTSPNDVITSFLEFIRALPKFKRNQISTNLAADAPSFPMDSEQIQQVLLNLVNNAVEAYPSAAIEIATKYDESKNTVTLSVQDNGPGIDVKIRDKLFEEKITTKVNGHGYGLRICRQIVESHGGKIHVQSPPNLGAMFVLTFRLGGQNGA